MPIRHRYKPTYRLSAVYTEGKKDFTNLCDIEVDSVWRTLKRISQTEWNGRRGSNLQLLTWKPHALPTDLRHILH